MNPSDLHESVSRAYTEALRRSREQEGGGCCGAQAPCCGTAANPASTTAGLAGYDAAADAYADAAGSSFGCGNPLAFAEVRPGQTVVDLGSGAGLDLLLAAERVGPRGRVIGVDMTPAMIEAARASAAAAGHENVEVREGFIENLPLSSGSADWVISNCVINLSPDKPRVFSEISRVLAPGGRFSISDIVVESLPAELRGHAVAYAACVAGAISEDDYLAGLRAAGLVDVEVTERLVYDAEQIRGIVASDLDNLGGDASLSALLDRHLPALAGKVWSAKITGRKPRA
jgi:arsenite methyltransferase